MKIKDIPLATRKPLDNEVCIYFEATDGNFDLPNDERFINPFKIAEPMSQVRTMFTIINEPPIIDFIYNAAADSLQCSPKKCIVLTQEDYNNLKEHLFSNMLQENPLNKNSNVINSFKGVNVYCDNSVLFSFLIQEDIYIEAKKIRLLEYITPIIYSTK